MRQEAKIEVVLYMQELTVIAAPKQRIDRYFSLLEIKARRGGSQEDLWIVSCDLRKDIRVLDSQPGCDLAHLWDYSLSSRMEN